MPFNCTQRAAFSFFWFPSSYLVAVVEDRDLVALAHEFLGQVEPEEGVASALGVGDEDRVGAAEERSAAGRGRGSGAGGEGGAHFEAN